ncbi:MAG TPA: phenylalanine--tRNA ligase subunit alpha, partial [Firmicutes bacterium]|nr:phenylalanine--tRNA ligase subunit alpha [Bacillota bacterium]
MREQLQTLRETAWRQIAEAGDTKQLDQIRVRYLGKKGELTALLRSMGSLSPEERPVVGKMVNQLREEMEKLLEERYASLEAAELARRLQAEKIDITLPGRKPARGRKHPLTQVLDEIKAFFIGMGFQVVEGPEVELDYYNFEALNIPPDHPARDMQDTFFITEGILLRSQTSPVQIRVMESQRPPVRIIA